MLGKLEEAEARFNELEKLIQLPEVMKNNQVYSEYLKEHGFLNRIVSIYRKYKKAGRDIEDAREILEQEEDKDLRELAREEIEILGKRQQELYEEIQENLISKDEDTEKNVIVEIRAGTGGDEASLFAGDLFQMYSKLAERKRWKLEVLDSSPTDLGGFNKVTFAMRGKKVYGEMKHESGTHRVQRVPTTESSGRLHTSACTVAVLPEAEEVEIEIGPKDLKIDTLRSSGPGGQNVNKTSSAIRITHLPTGIVVNCQDTPEQYKNKMKAMRILRSRLLQKEKEEQHKERNEMRRSQQGSGDRSEKIRTYNFPQSRITDHRIKFSLHNLDAVMQGGELDEMLNALHKHEREQRLRDLQTLEKSK